MSPVPWLAVWTVLVLATVGVGVVLWRGLWQRVRALHTELDRAGTVLADLERAAAAGGSEPSLPAPVLADPGALARIRARRAVLRRRSRARREARVDAATGRWRATGLIR